MSTHQASSGDFRTDLTMLLPRLRTYALSLTRSSDQADDLVQQTSLKALAGQKSFQQGTNLAGWLFRIQRNEFISGVRRVRPTVVLDDVLQGLPSQAPLQESGISMRQFMSAFDRLAAGQRKALLMTALDGAPYDEIAALSGVSVGTIKSRVSRARLALRQTLGVPEGEHFATA
jgi:RNA polymerase sigma-70 factor (ECF subfamily)